MVVAYTVQLLYITSNFWLCVFSCTYIYLYRYIYIVVAYTVQLLYIPISKYSSQRKYLIGLVEYDDLCMSISS